MSYNSYRDLESERSIHEIWMEEAGKKWKKLTGKPWTNPEVYDELTDCRVFQLEARAAIALLLKAAKKK
jgi:hypothetical protein